MAYEDDFLAQLQRGIGKPFLNPQPNALLPPALAAPAAPAPAPVAPAPSQEVMWVPHDSGGATNWGGPYYQPANANATGGPVPNVPPPPTGAPLPPAMRGMVMPGQMNSLANLGQPGMVQTDPAASSPASVAGSIYGYGGNDAVR